MPRNPVINRRNVDPLQPQKVPLTPEAMTILTERAAQLHVSKGSLADAAIREMHRLAPRRLAELLQRHGHLTEEEFAAVLEVIGEAPSPQASQEKEGDA